jgi:Kef-type K+ transport system membrane component KefB
MSAVGLFLIQTLLVIAAPFAIWTLPSVRRIVPLVVLQILFGLMFGPFLTRIAPDFVAAIFPPASTERLSGLAWLAAVTFTFLTGLHLDIGEFAGKSRSFFSIGASSAITPFIFGMGLGAWAVHHCPELMGPNGSEIGFILAIGVSVSATALPVLGAILRETRLIHREIGRLALGYAAFNDVFLWVLIAALSTMGDASSTRVAPFVAIVPSTLVYFGLMAFLLRPLLGRLFDFASGASQTVTPGQIVLVASTFLASALLTEAMGLHYLIGAFTAGVIMPKSLRPLIVSAFEPLCIFVLLPFYFVVTGLKVNLEIGSSQVLLFFALSTVCAMGGKILGTVVPAKLAGQGWRESLQLGVLLQTKGFVEVVVLNVLLDSGFISSSAFSALILMAVLTTALTMPMSRALDAAQCPKRVAADRVSPDFLSHNDQDAKL